MELEIVNLSASCRLCLAHCSEEFTTLDDGKLAVQLELIFHTTFEPKDCLPNRVCNECKGLVKNINKFVLKVLSNQEYLDSLELSSTKSYDENLEDDDVKIDINELPPIEIEDENILQDANDEESIDNTQEGDQEAAIKSDPEEEEPEEYHAKHKKRKSKVSEEDQANRAKEDDLIRQYYKFRCDLCAEEASSLGTLQHHFRDVHQITGYIKCCDKKLYRRCRLLEHISKHLNPESFRCEICNKNYACKRSLQLHNMNTHLPDTEKPFKCSKCPQAFAKDYHLTAHMIRHVAVECPKCGKIMSSKLTLKDHLINMHGDLEQRLLVCDTCGMEFRSKPSFDRHVLSHQGKQKDTRIQCHLCDRWLTNKYGLKRHIRLQHTETSEQFVCGKCGKTAPNSEALLQHQRVVHAEEKFECTVCGKKFKRAINFKEHQATHTGQPLYTCNFCTQTFISNANMYSHQKRVHPVEWESRKKSKQSKP